MTPFHNTNPSKRCFAQEPIEKEVTFGKLAEEASLILKSSMDRGVALEQFQDHDQQDEMEAKLADTNRPRPSDFRFQIYQFLSNNDLKSALNVLERDMRREYVKPDVRHFRLLIHACGKVGHVRKANELYKEYETRALDWNHGIIADMFNACANANVSDQTYALAKAKQLRLNLDRRNVTLSKVTYHNMIKAFGRCGDLELAFSVLDEMKTRKVLIDNETLNHLLHGCISDKEAGFRHAIAAWKLVETHKVQPDGFAYKLLLRATQECGAGDQNFSYDILLSCMSVDEAREHRQRVLTSGSDGSKGNKTENEVLENGLQVVEKSQLVTQRPPELPNVLHKRPNFNGIVGLGDLSTPENRFLILGGIDGFFQHLQENKIKPDIVTFSLALKVIPDNEEAENELLKKMEECGVEPDIDFFNQLIKRRAFRKDYSSGKATLQLINKYGLSLDIMTFGNLALCCDSRFSALELLKDMKENEYRPTVEILHVFLKSAAMRRSPRDVLLFLHIMDQNAIKPNPKVLKTVEKFNKIFKTHVKEWERGKKDLNGLPKSVQHEVMNDFKHWYKFSSFYQSWLRRTKYDPLEHPLKQYLTEKDLKKADEGVPYLKKIVDNSEE